jgi:hypothetical protein
MLIAGGASDASGGVSMPCGVFGVVFGLLYGVTCPLLIVADSPAPNSLFTKVPLMISVALFCACTINPCASAVVMSEIMIVRIHSNFN